MTNLSAKERQIKKIKNSPPIFIIGSQRSGTSFLYRLVQKYLKIGFGRDNGNFVRMANLLPYYGDLNDAKNLKKLIKDIVGIPEFKKRFRGLKINPDEFINNMEERTYPEVVRRFYAEWAYFKNTDRWGGKTPDYSIYARELYELFPDAKFIHIIRDGRDVALSLFNLSWGPKDSFLAAKHWKDRVQSAIEFGRELSPESYLEIRYESLLKEPTKQFELILNFIEHDGNCDEVIRQFRNEIGDSIKKDNFEKWRQKMSPGQIKAFERIGGDLLQKLGYSVVFPEVSGRPVRIWHYGWHYSLNAFRKVSRGEGFKGVYEKLYRSIDGTWVKVMYYLRRFKLVG